MGALNNKFFALSLLFLSTGCGNLLESSLLNDESVTSVKMACPGDHQGFFVCMSTDSSFSSSSLQAVIQQGLGKLADLINSSSFQGQVDTDFSSSGQGIDSTLTSANYIVTITGYCDPNGDALASAIVGGNTIQYNECRVTNDASGQPDLAIVSGVLLHEISHNLGYTHPATDPSRMTVPYHLGDMAQADLTTGSSGSSAGAVVDGDSQAQDTDSSTSSTVQGNDVLPSIRHNRH